MRWMAEAAKSGVRAGRRNTLLHQSFSHKPKTRFGESLLHRLQGPAPAYERVRGERHSTLKGSILGCVRKTCSIC